MNTITIQEAKSSVLAMSKIAARDLGVELLIYVMMARRRSNVNSRLHEILTEISDDLRENKGVERVWTKRRS